MTLYLPAATARQRTSAHKMEARLREAVAHSKTGEWEGHGFDLAKQVFDTRFKAAKAEPLLDAVRQTVNKLERELPEGWRLTVRLAPDWDEETAEI